VAVRAERALDPYNGDISAARMQGAAMTVEVLVHSVLESLGEIDLSG
jgi:hypothetical protein